MTVMRHFKSFLTLSSLFIINVLLRFRFISQGPYHIDCVTMARQAQLTLQTGHLHYLHSHGFPLSAMIAAANVCLARLWGTADPVDAVNIMSVFFSALSVPLFYLVVRKLTEPLTALISAVLFSVSPIFLSLSVFGNTNVLSLFFCLLCFYRIIDHKDNPSPGKTIANGLCLGLWGAVRIQDFLSLLPVLLIYSVLFHPPKKTKTSHMKAFGFSVLIAFIVTGLFYVPFLTRHLEPSATQSLGHFWEFEVGSRLFILSARFLFLSLIYWADNFLLLGILLAGLGHLVLWQSNRKLLFFLLSWCLIPLLLFSRLDIVMPRFFLCAVLPLYVMQGAVLAFLWRRRALFKIIAIFVIILSVWLNLYRIVPVIQYRHDHAVVPDYVLWLKEKTESNACMIPGDEGDFLRYYHGPDLLELRLKIRTPYSGEELRKMKRQIDQELGRGHPVYINYITMNSHNPKKQFSNLLSRHYTLICIGEKLYEDWHRGAMYQFIYPVAVYKIIREK